MKKLLSVILALIVGFSFVVPATMNDAHAATKGTAAELVRIASSSSYAGKNLSGVKSAMKKDGYVLWNPNYTGYWCAWYVVNCAKAAGIPTTVIPRTTWADDTYSREYGDGYYGWAKKEGIFKKSKSKGGTYTPKAGDLIFFNWDCRSVQHVEIVRKVENGKVYTVGGNTGGGVVCKRSWSLSSSSIYGYAAVKYKAAAPNTWTVKYCANGGKGSMASTKHTYGVKSYISKNTYTRDGYTFGGWYAHRVSDDTWRYGNGTENGYYKKDQQPAGFELVPWNDHTWIWKTTTVNNDVIELYAKWDERPCHTWVEWTTAKPGGKLPNYPNVAVDNIAKTAAVGETCYMTIQSDGMYPVYRYEFYLQKPGDSDFVLVGAYDAGEGKKLVCKGVPVTFEKAGTYKFKIKQFRREGGDWNTIYISPNNNGSSRNIIVQ